MWLVSVAKMSKPYIYNKENIKLESLYEPIPAARHIALSTFSIYLRLKLEVR